MATSRLEMTIPRQSITYLVLCILGILIFIVAGIIPYYRTIVKLDQKINRFSVDVEENKYLVPVYVSLKNKINGKDEMHRTLPSKESIAREQTDRIFMTFSEIARKTGMNVVSIVPNINSLAGNIKFLSVNVIVWGDYFNFRKFLNSAGEVPYLEHIEEIEIQQTPEGREYRMKLWLSVS